MISKQKIDSILNSNDISDYRWINPKKIVVAQWVRVKCVFGCKHYGTGSCPPNTPSVNECDKFFKEYEKAILIKLNKFADKESYPSGWSKEMTKRLLNIERDIFLLGHQKVFLLNQDCCTWCEDCSGDRINCKNKKNSRPSIESFAVDVFRTVRNAGLEINVITDSPAEINKIAILLIE